MTCSIPTTNNSNLKEYIHDQILKDVIEGTLQPNMILHEKSLWSSTVSAGLPCVRP